MYVELAISKLNERVLLDKKRTRLRITKTQIAAEAGVSVSAVCQWFRAKNDSERIEKTVTRLLSA